jgi:DNA-binding response OmpR family regulator/two-component sensor histidine kinase
VWRSRIGLSLELEKREQERKLRFFTNVSHEFRTPLTLIVAQVEQILSNRELGEKVRGDISKVLDNASHMRELISELLDFRKARQGYTRLRIEGVDLGKYVEGICRSFTEYADKHRINFVLDIPEPATTVAFIDPTQMKKAIFNLLSNAFKYTSDGGEIRVMVRHDAAVDGPGGFRIVVEDNGIGIPAEVLSRIFERFYQVEHRTSGFSLGTGIGLALTKEIIERHRGEISVRSTLNKGSLFEIRLPEGDSHFSREELSPTVVVAADHTAGDHAAADHAAGVAQHAAGPCEPWSILIVEDNEPLLDLLAEMFGGGECTVLRAVNGQQGLEMAEKHLPDLILCDIMMPVMSGTEMCRQIRSDIKLSHIPVVMLTSLDSVDQTIAGFELGADEYVAKPFDSALLKARCTALVRSRRMLNRRFERSRELAGVDVRSEREVRFLERVTSIIRANFENPAFDMNTLASELGLGRNRLYTTMKEITGMTPNDFTLSFKLRCSTELLKHHHHLNISEIADKLGFSSTKYFSRCFKSIYGVTPVQWRKEN